MVVYYGSRWKDYAVWQAAPWIAHRLGCVERLRGRVRQRLDGDSGGAAPGARALLVAEPDLRNAFVVAACRESYLLDYGNERSRFMFNFGDGAVAGLVTTGADRNLLLGSHAITDGSFALQVKVPAGAASAGLARVRRRTTPLPRRRRPSRDEERSRRGVARRLRRRGKGGAGAVSDATVADISYVCGIHMKRSMHEEIVAALGVDPSRAA